MTARETLTLALLVVLMGCGGDEPADWSRSSTAAESETTVAATATGNRAPVIERVALDPPEPAPGQRVRAVVAATDPDGDAVELRYVWRFGGKVMTAAGASVEMPLGRSGEALEVQVTASDGQAQSATASARGSQANARPRLVELMLDPPDEVARGAVVSVSARAGDVDGDPLEFRYRWAVNGRWVDARERSFSTEGLERGDRIRVEVVASDGSVESEPLESVEVVVANAPPEIVSRPPGRLEDGEFRYPMEARDPDGDRSLRFRLLEGPEGMRVDSVSGAVSWRPAAGQVGAHPVDLAVEDPMGAATAQRFEITVLETGDSLPANRD